MPRTPFLRVALFAIALSTVAPLVLSWHGVDDYALLMVVFTPSVLVGSVTGWLATHRPSAPRPWVVDTQRMP